MMLPGEGRGGEGRRRGGEGEGKGRGGGGEGEGRGGGGGEEAFISAKLYIGMTFGTYQYLDLEHPHTWKLEVFC